MAIPQLELYDPNGKHLGTYERRADAEHAIQGHVQALGAKFKIDDSAWREQEAREQAAERVKAHEAAVAEQKREQAVAAKAKADAEAAHKRDLELLKEGI